MTGIIAANSNNGQWIDGIDWAAKILPVRVLGKCGGNDSDIIDGIAWAAGLAVPGAPANPYPAQVINLSLGGAGECEAGYHAVLSAALAHGVTRAIIVAAGNDGKDVSNSAPANCAEAIAVAATGIGGSLADYSNFGPGIALSAPGGSDPNGILVLWNDGKTIPATDDLATSAGTSNSAPMVSGVASLVLGRAPNLTAAQLRTLLTSTSTPFPVAATATRRAAARGPSTRMQPSSPRKAARPRPTTRGSGGTRRPTRNRAGGSTSRTRVTRYSRAGSPTTSTAADGGS